MCGIELPSHYFWTGEKMDSDITNDLLSVSNQFQLVVIFFCPPAPHHKYPMEFKCQTPAEADAGGQPEMNDLRKTQQPPNPLPRTAIS